MKRWLLAILVASALFAACGTERCAKPQKRAGSSPKSELMSEPSGEITARE